MEIKITEEVLLSHIGNKTYFSEEEFPQVPRLLIGLIKTAQVTVTATLEWALQQADSLNEDGVFLMCLLASARAKPRLSDKDFEEGKPIKMLNEVAPRMMSAMIKEGEYKPIFLNYKTACGLT